MAPLSQRLGIAVDTYLLPIPSIIGLMRAASQQAGYGAFPEGYDATIPQWTMCRPIMPLLHVPGIPRDIAFGHA